MRKSFWTNNNKYNTDITDKWEKRIEKEILPLAKEMLDEGFIVPEIVKFISDQIDFELLLYRIDKEIKEIKVEKE